MDHVRRVIVHDKSPIYDPAVLATPANIGALLVTGISLLAQIAAVVILLTIYHESVAVHLSFAAVALLWLILGVLVFLQRQAGAAGRLFLLSAAAGSLFLEIAASYNDGLWVGAFFAAGLLFFPPLLISFVRAFPENRPWRREELLLYLPALLLVGPSATALAARRDDVYWRTALVLVALYMVVAVLQAAYDMQRARSAVQAAQSRALVFGLVAGTAPALVLFIVPVLARGGVAASITWLPVLILIFLAAMSYAVLLFEFSEGDLIVRRGVVYAALTLVIVAAYTILGITFAAGRTTPTSPLGGLGFIAVTVLVGAAFPPITGGARRLVDWVLYGRRADHWQLLQALSARLSHLMRPDEVGDVLVTETAAALHLRGAFLLRRVGDQFVVRHAVRSEGDAGAVSLMGMTVSASVVDQALGDPPEPVLIIHRKPFAARHRGVLDERFRVLDQLQASLSVPLAARAGLEAVLCLQPKLAHDAFDADDLALLAPVIRQASAALDNALLFGQLAEKVDELRDAYRRIAREQEAERARLARELHDGTAQELAGLITLAVVAEKQMGDGPARATVERIRRQAEDAYQGVRRASHALRPLMLDDFGLVPTVRRALDSFQEATGIAVRSELGDPGGLDSEVELALFRVVQECLENVRKHSGAGEVAVRLVRDERDVTLTVEDNGHGLGPGGSGGIGMAGMRERVEAIGGSMTVASGHGVRILVTVPVGERWIAAASS